MRQTAKPLGHLDFDRQHWSTQGLRVLTAMNGHGGPPFDLVSQCFFKSRSGGTPLSSTPSGYVATSTTQNQQLDMDWPTQRVTVLCIREKTDGTARDSALFGGNLNGAGSDAQRCMAHAPWVDGTLYWQFGGNSAPNNLSVAGLTFTGEERWAFVAGSRGSSIYRNGERIANQTTAITRTAGGSMYLNAHAQANVGDLQHFRFFAVLDAEWTASMVAEWDANPWLMFSEPEVTLSRSTNVALAANGGVASAPNSAAGYAASGAINGNRTLTDWGSDGGWGSSSGVPVALQVDFDASYTIDTINVITYGNLHGNAEPDLTTTFSQYGATSYAVEYWDGSAWQTIDSVTSNDKVWRQFTFASITTTKIRVNVTAAGDALARIVELEALEASALPPFTGRSFRPLMVSL
jgi:hypothetical protein